MNKKTPQQIISELRHLTNWSQPNVKYNEIMAGLNELEASLQPVEPIIEEPGLDPTLETEGETQTEEPTDLIEEFFQDITEEVSPVEETVEKPSTKKGK